MLLTARNCTLYDSIEECKHVYFRKSIWEDGWSAVGAPQGGSGPPHLPRKKLILIKPVTQVYNKCMTFVEGKYKEVHNCTFHAKRGPLLPPPAFGTKRSP